MSNFLNARFAGVAEYVPGEQPQDKVYIKLNTNESPFPPSKGVIAAVDTAAVEGLRLYPDPDCKALTKAIANRYAVDADMVFITNGSDDILNFAFMGFCDNGAVFPDITYGFYEVYANLYGVPYETKALDDNFCVNPADYYNAGKTVVIANPNAQTGVALPLESIEEMVKHNPDNLVVVDEAYVDFGAQSAVPLTKKYDNLLVVMTFSKSRSMAGARLGFAIGSKALIADFNRLKYSTNPYNINRLTQLAGTAALNEDAYYMDNCKEIVRVRERTRKELENRGFAVTNSQSNFLLAAHPAIEGKALYQYLKDNGVLVRYLGMPRIKNYNRITIGTEQQMQKMLDVIDAALEGAEK